VPISDAESENPIKMEETSMKSIKSLPLTFMTLLLFISWGNAHDSFQAGFNFSLGFPQNEFRDIVHQIGLSGSGHFVHNFRNSPFSAGVSLGFLVYGSETREELLDRAIPEVYVDVTTTNNIFLGHLLLRVQPQEGKFRPYLDGLIGFNHFYTSTRVHSQRYSEDDTIARNTLHNDLTFSYGAGGGLMIEVLSANQRERGDPVKLSIDMAVRFLRGGRAEYLKKGSINLQNERIVYAVERSTTDFLTGSLGISFSF